MHIYSQGNKLLTWRCPYCRADAAGMKSHKHRCVFCGRVYWVYFVFGRAFVSLLPWWVWAVVVGVVIVGFVVK